MSGITIRRAVFGDLEGIVGLFTGDERAGKGDIWSPGNLPAYERAMRAILASPATLLFVAMQDEHIVNTGRGPRAEGGRVAGTFQLTLIPGLAARGRTRAKVESVHVRPDLRGQGIGAALMARAVEEARAAGAGIMELSSDKRRDGAHRFYERLGFARSHEGFKLVLVDLPVISSGS